MIHLSRRCRLALCCSLAFAGLISLAAIPVRAAAEPHTFKIAAGSAADTLRDFGRQAKLQTLFNHRVVKDLRTQPVTGLLEPEEALAQMLLGTGLTFERVDPRTLAIRARGSDDRSNHTSGVGSNPLRLAAAEGGEAARAGVPGSPESARAQSAEAGKQPPNGQQLEEIRVTIPEVLVVGSKILNMDIPRTEDDAQPYVIYDRKVIEQSQAATIEDFLKNRLPMNTQQWSNAQSLTSVGNGSQINLRGLGAGQTLILVDGHRVASGNGIGSPLQADINGIPLAAIERIEVLPMTASGIYGGSATGGVINIVLRRDYVGSEAKITYESTFDGGGSVRRVDLSTGFTLEDGRSNVLLAGSYSDADPLLMSQRDFVRENRLRALANNPSSLSGTYPPLGATTNIRSADGSPLFGPGTPSFTFVPVGYAGGGGLAPLQANAGQYNVDLPHSMQDIGALLNGPTVKQLMTTLRREFTRNLQVFIEGSASSNAGHHPLSLTFMTHRIPATAPNNPFGQDILVNVPTAAGDSEIATELRNRRVVGGIIVALPSGWNLEADYTWNRFTLEGRDPPTLSGAQSAAIADGTLDVLRDTNAFPLDLAPYFNERAHTGPARSTLKDATLRLAGAVGSWSAGSPTVSLLVERRDEIFDESAFTVPAFDLVAVSPSRSQTVDSVYLETRLPLVSARNRRAGAEELELQLAGRHDRYRVNGATGLVLVGPGFPPAPVEQASGEVSSTDPTLAVRYRPVADLMLRASYGTGFLPPRVDQLLRETQPITSNEPDPKRGDTPVGTVQGFFGGNADLQPEQSESWSFGAVLTPRFVPGLRLSVDYLRIDKTDNIVSLTTRQILDNEDVLPGRVVRGTNLPGDPPGWAGPITQMDRSFVNIARAKLEAYDLALDYQLETDHLGTFDFFTLATRQTHYLTQLVPAEPIIENVGTSGFLTSLPLELKGNGGVTWKYAHWTLGWSVRYFDSYRLTNATHVLNQGAARVPSQTYHDFFASYQLSKLPGFFSGAEVQLGIKNVFNEEPPYDGTFSTFSLYSSLGDPRLAVYSLSVKASF